jgi:hypothetical protein
MNEELTPRELANAKMQARAARIRNIRRRVAIAAATLTAVFSGVILARTQLDQPADPQGDQIALVNSSSADSEPEKLGTAEMIVTLALGAVTALTSDEDDEYNKGYSSSSSSSTSTSTTPLETSQS